MTTKQPEIIARLFRIPVPVYAPYLLLTAAVLAVYANVYGNAFVFDDFLLIVQNRSLRHWDNLPDFITPSPAFGWHVFPLTMLLWFFIWQAFGPVAAAFHALNVGLHVLNTGLVWRLGCGLGLRPRVSFAAALLWAVHPLQTEAVTYMSCAPDLLYSFFCLLGLLVLLPDFAPRKFWLAGLLFVLALASKESAVVFPALATISLFLLSRERLRPSTYYRTWPLWLLAGIYIGGWLTYFHASGVLQQSPQDDPVFFTLFANNIVNRILTCLAALSVYFGLMAWPAGLHMDRSFPIFTGFGSWQVIASATMVAGVLLQIALGRGRRGLIFSWGFLWFAAAFSPTCSIVVLVDALIAEHWMYLPTVGIALGAAGTVAAWLDDKPENVCRAAAVLVAAAALALSVKTVYQNEVWRNPLTFYENIFRCGEQDNRGHYNLGLYYLAAGEHEKAAEQFRMVISSPDRVTLSMMTDSHAFLALSYLNVTVDFHSNTSFSDLIQELDRVLPLATEIHEAVGELHKSLAIDPDFYPANAILAMIYARQGDSSKASYYSDRASSLQKTAP